METARSHDEGCADVAPERILKDRSIEEFNRSRFIRIFSVFLLINNKQKRHSRLFQVELLLDYKLRQPFAFVEPGDGRFGGEAQLLGHIVLGGELFRLLDLCNEAGLERLFASHLPALPEAAPLKLHLLAQLLQLVLLHLPPPDDNHPDGVLSRVVDTLRLLNGAPFIGDDAVDLTEGGTGRGFDDFLVHGIRLVGDGKAEVGQGDADCWQWRGHGIECGIVGRCWRIGDREAAKGTSEIGQVWKKITSKLKGFLGKSS